MTREHRFLLGALAGTALLAAGLVTVVLALSVTVRDPVGVPPAIRTAGLALGAALVPVGLLLGRRRVALAGAVLFVAAGSTAVTGGSNAPTVSQIDRWALGALSLALFGGGAWLLRRAARAVGVSG